MTAHRPVALIIMDGWGIRAERDHNAVLLARTPTYHRLMAAYPHTRLTTSGEAVGLPAGQMGNSEVGHLNLGAGRIVFQELQRIGNSIRSGEFFHNPAFLGLLHGLKERGAALHLMGLVSNGGVHSHQDHLYALLELAARQGISKVYLHAFMDGRDCPPRSGAGFMEALVGRTRELGCGMVASVSGRYYAMDRDQRWERVRPAFEAVAQARGARGSDPVQAILDSYAAGKTDEFILPVVMDGAPAMQPGDGVIFFNFRADRAREMCLALTDAKFDGFPREVPGIDLVTMTEYRENFTFPTAYRNEPMKQILGEVFAHQGLRNLRTAETEKYAHVTYFFNGGQETPFEGEDRILIPSAKVATYDLQPEMSAPELTESLLAQLALKKHDAIVVNYANPDMVGHTGVLEAAIRAVETVDQCVGRVVNAILARGGAAMITADHGNCEQMWDEVTHGPHTSHTTNPVPFLVVEDRDRRALREGGILADVAPTFLGLLGLPQPAEMTGRDLRIHE